MITLDMQTVMFTNVIINFVGMVVMFILWFQNRNKYSGIAYWVLDWVLLTGGTLLITLQGTIPSWESMILSNSMIVGGTIILYFGLSHFAGKKNNTILISTVLVLFAMFIAVHTYFVYADNELLARSYNAAAGLLLICSLCAWLMFRGVSKQIRRISKGTGISFAIIAVVCAMRILGFSLIPQTGNQFLQSGKFDALMVVFLVGAITFLVFSLVLMVNRRLHIETEEAEEALKASEEKYSTLIEQSVDGILILKNRLVTFANRRMREMTGFSQEEILGKMFVDLAAPEYKEMLEEEYHRRQAGEEISGNHELGILTKDGRKIPVETKVQRIIYQGQPAVMSIIRDITARKQAEEALQESEEYLKTYLENAPDGVYLSDLNGSFLYGNKKAEKIMGYKKEELIGSSFLQLNILPAKYLEKARELLTFSAMGINTGPDEFELIRKDKSHIWVEINTASIKQKKSNIVVGFVRDITERKQAEEELSKSQKQYRTLVDNASEAIAVAQDGHLKYINKATLELFTGYSEQELIGKPFLDFVHPGDRARILEYFSKRLKKEPLLSKYEYRVIIQSGVIKWVETHSALIEWESKPATLNFTTDITERKKTEELIRASLAEKEILLKEVHHRVKNNMQVISSLLRLQAGRVRDKDSADLLRDSQNRIQSMALVYNKLYQSQDMASIDMADYIKELTAGLIRSYASSPNSVKLNVVSSGVLLGVDTAIPCGLVINELVTNSFKYAFPENRKGQIAVSLTEDNSQELELVVSDDGVGIPDDIDLAESSTLGLKLVGNLVQNQLGGKMELVHGQGTTFKITFRRAKEER